MFAPTRIGLFAVLLCLVAALTALTSTRAWAGSPVTVDVEDDFFDPDLASNGVGQGGVTWSWGAGTSNEHNVKQDVGLFRSGDPETTGTFTLNLISAGTYHYYCQVHGSKHGGMDGKAKIAPVWFHEEPGEDLSFRIAWAFPPFQSGGAFDVRFRVNDGKWRMWRNDTKKGLGTFGRNGKPVTVHAGRQYQFQVRSEKASNPSKHSGWSPILTVIGGQSP